MKQATLFDQFREELAPPPAALPTARQLAKAKGPETSTQAAREIVETGSQERQCQKVLELLRLRPVSAAELVGVATNFRARVSDLRKLGHVINVRDVVSAATGGKIGMYFLDKDADE